MTIQLIHQIKAANGKSEIIWSTPESKLPKSRMKRLLKIGRLDTSVYPGDDSSFYNSSYKRHSCENHSHQKVHFLSFKIHWCSFRVHMAFIWYLLGDNLMPIPYYIIYLILYSLIFRCYVTVTYWWLCSPFWPFRTQY